MNFLVYRNENKCKIIKMISIIIKVHELKKKSKE